MSIQKNIKQAQALPMDKKDEWIMERRTFSVPVEEVDSTIHPDILVCISTYTDLALGATILPPKVPESEILSWALECMLSPMDGEPHRPGKITLTGGKLKHLQKPLEELGISVTAKSFTSPLIDEVVSALEYSLTSPGAPPYLERKGVDPDTVANFFRAAADFYRTKPWKLFEFEIPIRVEIQSKKSVTYWAVVMGCGGEEFGMTMYRSAEDLIELLESSEDEEEVLEISQRIWSAGFSFMSLDDIGPDAQNECTANGWVLANESAYPMALVLDPKSKDPIHHPSNKELADLTMVIDALVPFFKANKKKIENEEYIDEIWQVQAAGQKIDVAINLPAPEFIEDDELDEEEIK